MTSSAPHSPARWRDTDTDSNASPSRPSPLKLLRLQQLDADTIRAASLPPRRLLSPAKKIQVRPRLNQYFNIDHAVSLLKTSKNIVVLTGAGISTSLGVPDFRSKDGVYNLLDDSVYDDPQELFHIDNFKADPAEFFRQARKVFPRMQGLVPTTGSNENPKSTGFQMVPKYSTTHAFLSLLQAKNKLLTNYTQNIDGLETAAGVSSSRLIQCHGSLSTASCMSCGKRLSANKYMPIVHAGGIPVCKCSRDKDEQPKGKKERIKVQRGRTGKKKKRKRDEYEDTDTDSDDQNSGPTFMKGLLKPDMTFFGEHVSHSYEPRLDTDKTKVDLLIIIGTSLKVAPVNDMPITIPPMVPQVWISKERCQREGVKVDIELLGECDIIIEEICRRAGWLTALNDRKWTHEKAEIRRLRGRDSSLSLKSCRDSSPEKRMKTSASATRTQSLTKSHHALEMRPKLPKAPNVSLTVTPIIRLNDADLPPSPDLALHPGTPSSGTNQPAEAHEARQTSTTGTERKALQLVEQPPKVIIELEAGTRSRWFVRRAK